MHQLQVGKVTDYKYWSCELCLKIYLVEERTSTFSEQRN